MMTKRKSFPINCNSDLKQIGGFSAYNVIFIAAIDHTLVYLFVIIINLPYVMVSNMMDTIATFTATKQYNYVVVSKEDTG